MARIKAFKPLLFEQGLKNTKFSLSQATSASIEPNELKSLLEHGGSGGEIDEMEIYKRNLEELIQNGVYIQVEEPSLFIYQFNSNNGLCYGLWALTNLQDLFNGVLTTHERTIAEKEAKLLSYRKNTAIEGQPILITYEPDFLIDRLMRGLINSDDGQSFNYGKKNHRIWAISCPKKLKEFASAFSRVTKTYVADGHHRLAAAAQMHNQSPQWISSLYVSTDQILVKEFNRLVIPRRADVKDILFRTVSRYYWISYIQNNVPFRSNRLHRMGMLFAGKWFQLDLKANLHQLEKLTDVSILQQKILKPVFGIDDPKNDNALFSYSADEWNLMLSSSERNESSVVFTLYPMSIQQIIEKAELQEDQPPKSTYIEPKIPFGLLLFRNKELEVDRII